MTMFSLVCG